MAPLALAFTDRFLGRWAYGSYSNWPVGVTLEKHENLRANVGRVWFAGEANSAQYFGFLHGAWFEGREVGERVASALGGNNTVYSTSSNMTRYEVLYGTTTYSEYNAGNGWPVSSFLTYGLDE